MNNQFIPNLVSSLNFQPVSVETGSTTAPIKTNEMTVAVTTKLSSTDTTVNSKCDAGYWGDDCFFLCSDGCDGDEKTCDKNTGKCTDGCKTTKDGTENVNTHDEGLLENISQNYAMFRSRRIVFETQM